MNCALRLFILETIDQRGHSPQRPYTADNIHIRDKADAVVSTRCFATVAGYGRPTQKCLGFAGSPYALVCDGCLSMGFHRKPLQSCVFNSEFTGTAGRSKPAHYFVSIIVPFSTPSRHKWTALRIVLTQPAETSIHRVSDAINHCYTTICRDVELQRLLLNTMLNNIATSLMLTGTNLSH